MDTPNHCQLMQICSRFVAAHGGVDAAARTLGLPTIVVHRALTVERPELEHVLIRIAEEIGDRAIWSERRFVVVRRDVPRE